MRVLLLSGVGEAQEIAQGLTEGGADVTMSFATKPRQPEALCCGYRIGPFGGDAGFERFLESEQINAVLDASHPFSARVSARTARICSERQLPYARYLRPAWAPQKGDRWAMLAEEAEAARHVPKGACVFLATGRSTLAEFANLEGCEVIARRNGPATGDFPFKGGRFLESTPPFSVASETALFKELGVDWLILRNAGGQGARAKIDAARALGITVGMIQRPAAPVAEVIDSPEGCMRWLRGGL